VTAAATAPRGLLVDLSATQRAEPDRAARWVGELAAALLEIPGAVRALLLDPALPLPGSLHPALFSSPLLRWNTATELRRAGLAGPVAYLVPWLPGQVPGGTLLPAPVAERDMPLVMVRPPGASAESPLARVGLDLYRHADLVITSSSSEAAASEAAARRAAVVPLVSGLDADSAEWRRSALGIVDAVQALDRTPRVAPAAGAPLRVALVGALPPSAAPSAVTVARLAEALAPRCRLLLASDDRPDPGWLERLDVPLHAVDSLSRGGLAWSCDAVVHVVGASAADLPALRSARRLPGVLWLHDVRLAGPHRAEAAVGPKPGATLAAVLRRIYADRAPAPLLAALDAGDTSGFDAAAEQRYGLLLTGEVVRQARAVMVGSLTAARRVRLDQGASAPCPPIVVIDADDLDAAADRLLVHVALLARRDEPPRVVSGARTEVAS